MKYSVILLISILFVGCKSDKKDYIRCDEVRTILSFAEEIELKNPSVVPVDLTGCVDIIQADSLMICKKADGEYFREIYYVLISFGLFSDQSASSFSRYAQHNFFAHLHFDVGNSLEI